ncbi:MAG: hypothetical protein DKT66_11295 [Candidatus Melainabacteria bacterium]|nr:MAG: hypothetical protein DKT66_11295 [Candidatus Melainabacteria bacterium]
MVSIHVRTIEQNPYRLLPTKIMARSAEISESVDAPVESPQQSLVGESLVNQSDSDIARSAAQGTQDDAIAMLDPKGNEFRIDGLNEGQEQNFLNMLAQDFSRPLAGDKPSQVDKPVGIDKPVVGERPPEAGAQGDQNRRIFVEGDGATNTEDGLVKSVLSKNETNTMKFSTDGKLQSFTTQSNDGFSTTTNFDETGRATSRTMTDAQGQTHDIGGLSRTFLNDTRDAEGNRFLRINETGRQLDFKLDSDGNIRQATQTQGFNYDSMTFDERGNVKSEYTRRTNDGIMTGTYTQTGYRETEVINKATDETTITRVNQLDPWSKRIDLAGQRTDVINMRPDGSSEATTTFRNEPGTTYRTHTGSDGRYQTDKVNDTTGEKRPYRQGSQSRSA